MITEAEYKKLSKEEQDKHHKEIRDELIERGLLKPFVEAKDNLK